MLEAAENVTEDTALPEARETVAGLKVTDIPVGGVDERVTLPVKPDPGVSISVVVTLPPAIWFQEF
jgi:hypothetical protein